MADTPSNPYLLGYTDVRYRVDLLDVVTPDMLRNPAVEMRVIADLAKFVAREYQALGYRARASVLRNNGYATRPHSPVLFPHYAPQDGDTVYLVDPTWQAARLESTFLPAPPDEVLWGLTGTLLPRSLRQNPEKLYRPLWLDLETGYWLAFTTIPHDVTIYPLSICHPYPGPARGHDIPAPPDPEAHRGRVQYLQVKAPPRLYADLHAATN